MSPLLRCPLLNGRGSDEYVFDTCAIQSCKYHGVKAKGHCIAQHTLAPSVHEIAFFKDKPVKEITDAKNAGKRAVTNLLLLQRYACFANTTTPLPADLPESFHQTVADRLAQFPYNDVGLELNVTPMTFAAMVLPSTYTRFIEDLTLDVADKLRQHTVMHLPLAEHSQLRKHLEGIYDPVLFDQLG